MTKNNIDITSDLHIDQWSDDINSMYPLGKVKNYPFLWGQKHNSILIVAGDIADNLEESIKYLDSISNYYKKILFVDGNHEHVYKYPKLYTKEDIQNLVNKYNNPKLVYLTNNPYQINDTIIIGCCGWWNYENGKNISINLNYFKNWIKEFNILDNLEFMRSVMSKVKHESYLLEKTIEKYQNDNKINKIVIVTHTVPRHKYCDKDSSDLQLNTEFLNFSKYSKIKIWIFGHTHKQWDTLDNNIRYISNPRGRPEDYNREKYQLKTISF